MLGPDGEERNTMVHFRRPEQAAPGRCASPLLAQLQNLEVIGRSGPELPGHDTGGVPRGIPVRLAVAPGVAMPAQPEDRLPADAAMPRSTRKGGLPIRCRRRAEGHRQTGFLVGAETPLPPCRLSTFGRKRPREPVSQERAMPPVGFHGAALGRRDEGLPERMRQNAGREQRRETFLEPGARLLVLLVSPSRHPDQPSRVNRCRVRSVGPKSEIHFWVQFLAQS